MINLSEEEKQTLSKEMEAIGNNSFNDDEKKSGVIPEITEEEFKRLPTWIQQSFKRKFDIDSDIEEEDYILVRLNEDGTYTNIASFGDFILAYGPPKSRKSTLMMAIAASAYVDIHQRNLGFMFDLPKGHEVLWFDTEMGKYRYRRRMRTFHAMCNHPLDNLPNFQSYMLKGLGVEEKRDVINYHVERTLKYKPIGLIVIDQLADLSTDQNDNQQDAIVMADIEAWQSTGAIVMGAIHTTKTTHRATGSIGHTFEKKLDTGFLCVKDKATKLTEVSNFVCRDEEVPDFNFTHDDNKFPRIVIEDDTQF